jgi:hypothetical protein
MGARGGDVKLGREYDLWEPTSEVRACTTHRRLVVCRISIIVCASMYVFLKKI